jgi:O-antigen biosynthesis protein WbqP
VNKLLPGITGLAQIKGRDELSISEKVDLDIEYLNRRSIWLDFKILLSTFYKVLSKEGVSH